MQRHFNRSKKVLTIGIFWGMAVLSGWLNCPVVFGQKVYFIESDAHTSRIMRCNLNGTELELVMDEGLGEPRMLAVDPLTNTLYFTDKGSNTIKRVRLDGTAPTTILSDGLKNPFGIALDLLHKKIYWSDFGTNAIMKANLDGSGAHPLIEGLESPRGIALDILNGKIYWTARAKQQIQRANLDGSEVEVIVAEGIHKPYGLAVDGSHERIFWSDTGSDKIMRADLDGGNPTEIISTGLDNPAFLQYRRRSGKIYFSDSNTGQIGYANADGSSPQILPLGALTSPRGLVIFEGDIDLATAGEETESIIPHPRNADEEIKITYSGNGFMTSIKVIALTGDIPFQSEGFQEKALLIPTAGWDPGIYYCRSRTSSGKEVMCKIEIE